MIELELFYYGDTAIASNININLYIHTHTHASTISISTHPHHPKQSPSMSIRICTKTIYPCVFLTFHIESFHIVSVGNASGGQLIVRVIGPLKG